jgi:hypothetical protein
LGTILNRLDSTVKKRALEQDELDNRTYVRNALKATQSSQTVQTASAASLNAKTASSGSSSIPISDVTGSRGLVSQQNKPVMKNSSKDSHIPISDITGSRGLVSLRSDSEDNGSGNNGSSGQTPHIPISVVTGGRDITTVSPQLRAYLQQGSPSAATAIPKEYADLANLLDKVTSDLDFGKWADMTTRQQRIAAQKSGLSDKDQWALLNAAPHYVETIAKVQDVFANRYALGLTNADARTVAKELFTIADERNEAITRTGKYANDAVFAPKALRWLDKQEEELLGGLGKDTNETGQPTWYNDEETETSADIHRQAKYADIDEAAATKQIEELLMKNIADAKKVAFLSNSNKLISEPTVLLSFYLNVKKNAAMDYKNPAVWYKTFPELPYPKEDKVYHVFGQDVSSSDLGNLNYGLVGKALGIDETLLLQQAGAAQLRDHPEHPYASELEKFVKTQIESIQQRDSGYGDQKDDQAMITNGFNVFKSLY